MRPVQYIFANRGLGMSPGKLAAQVAHASVLAADKSKSELLDEWLESGHYTKLVMLALDATHVQTIDRYLTDRGYVTCMVIDEGHTEIPAHSITALGVELVDKDDERVRQHFSDFALYREERNLQANGLAVVEVPAPEPSLWTTFFRRA